MVIRPTQKGEFPDLMLSVSFKNARILISSSDTGVIIHHSTTAIPPEGEKKKA